MQLCELRLLLNASNTQGRWRTCAPAAIERPKISKCESPSLVAVPRLPIGKPFGGVAGAGITQCMSGAWRGEQAAQILYVALG